MWLKFNKSLNNTIKSLTNSKLKKIRMSFTFYLTIKNVLFVSSNWSFLFIENGFFSSFGFVGKMFECILKIMYNRFRRWNVLNILVFGHSHQGYYLYRNHNW